MPPHTTPILRISDDVLEDIIRVVAQDADGRCNRNCILTLSHVCARVRHIILCCASFWNDLYIGENTSPEVIEPILRRSQRVPMHINIEGINTFKKIRDSGTKLETLLEAVAERMAEADSFSVSNIQATDSEVLSRACEAVNPIRQDVHPRILSISFSAFKDSTFNLVVGARLVSLSLSYLQDPVLPTLSKILHLAPNLEIVYILGLLRGAEPPEPTFFEAPTTGARLQIVQLNADGRRGSTFSRVVELMQRYSPHAISDGRVVELRTWDDSTFIRKMELKRFNDIHGIICAHGSSFTIQYPAWSLPTQRPVGQDALRKQLQESGGIDLMTRGFDADLSDLRKSESPAREVLCYSITMTRSLKLCQTKLSDALQLFIILAHDAWPMLEHISLELYLLTSHRIDRVDWNREPVGVPRLRTFEVVLCSCASRTLSDSEEVVQRWARSCITIIKAISRPRTARFTLRAHESKDYGDASVILAVIRRRLESDPIQFASTSAAMAI